MNLNARQDVRITVLDWSKGHFVRSTHFFLRSPLSNGWYLIVLFIFNSPVNVADGRMDDSKWNRPKWHMCASHETWINVQKSIAIGRHGHFDSIDDFILALCVASGQWVRTSLSAPWHTVFSVQSSRTKHKWQNWSRRPVIWFEPSTNKNNHLYLWRPHGPWSSRTHRRREKKKKQITYRNVVVSACTRYERIWNRCPSFVSRVMERRRTMRHTTTFRITNPKRNKRQRERKYVENKWLTQAHLICPSNLCSTTQNTWQPMRRRHRCCRLCCRCTRFGHSKGSQIPLAAHACRFRWMRIGRRRFSPMEFLGLFGYENSE